MKYLIVIFIAVFLLYGKNKNDKNSNPCNHPLIKLAESKGLKAVPLKDMIKLRRLMSSCEKDGGKDQILKLHENDWDRDYKKARRMASWTSTHAVLVSVTFVYYFAGKALATKPDKTG